MTTLDGAFYLAESEPPFIAAMRDVIQTAEPLPGALSPWSMRRIITSLYDGLLHLKALGRTPAQICEFLTEHSGLGITPSTLATYLSREKHQRQGGHCPPASQTSPAPAEAEAEFAPAEPDIAKPHPEQAHQPSQGQAAQASARSQRSPAAPAAASATSLPFTATAVDPAPSPDMPPPMDSQPSDDRMGSHIGSGATAPANGGSASAERSSLPQPNRKAQPGRKNRPPRRYEPDNPPAPESLLDEPTFNTIERD